MDDMAVIRRRTDNLTIYEMQEDDTNRIAVMETVFVCLMPQYAHYVQRLRRDIAYPGDCQSTLRHHVWLIEIGDAPAAMCAFEYVCSQNVGLGMDIAIYPEFRSHRYQNQTLAHFILHEMVCQLARDAIEAGQSPAVPMGGEVENDRLLARYMDYGFMSIPATYYEPPDVSGTADLALTGSIPFDAEIQLEAKGYHRMRVGFFPPDHPDFDPFDITLWDRLLKAFYVHHYHLSPQTLALQVALESIRLFDAQQPVVSVA